jgi:hypothetical protein
MVSGCLKSMGGIPCMGSRIPLWDVHTRSARCRRRPSPSMARGSFSRTARTWCVRRSGECAESSARPAFRGCGIIGSGWRSKALGVVRYKTSLKASVFPPQFNITIKNHRLLTAGFPCICAGCGRHNSTEQLFGSPLRKGHSRFWTCLR